ncbi:uncharacterized protein PHALS_12955 [Plasmopara halstedii]|uniref:Uncharacterized protein n=1 Tax=Plasmopara halstedii TaxID=4781 RepID=A0A0P1ANS9_PLAHL|nr:uncharacterized protein PHALS_12955 [Plasmopara halstedii]CEG42701.1 hypothetical protein PHALS_12955 [Plasmopara halstedii]|eukprot:XP_024579070.1 hypothetical protein PHALS_12955 [Plasmopara halstedii]
MKNVLVDFFVLEKWLCFRREIANVDLSILSTKLRHRCKMRTYVRTTVLEVLRTW